MRYHNITKDDMLNGDGLRVVLWTAGCSHCCPKCQNPVTWDRKNYISGVTFSGGDPLYLGTRADLLDLIKEIKEKFPSKTMWLYTGYLWEEVKNLELVSYLDVLVDGEFIYDQLDVTLKWKGSANQRVIDVQKSLEKNEVVLYA